MPAPPLFPYGTYCSLESSQLLWVRHIFSVLSPSLGCKSHRLGALFRTMLAQKTLFCIGDVLESVTLLPGYFRVKTILYVDVTFSLFFFIKHTKRNSHLSLTFSFFIMTGKHHNSWDFTTIYPVPRMRPNIKTGL